MRFYVNVDHVATLRQARRADEPDPVTAATVCEQAGANGITVHLREDRRHIQDEDVRRLAASVRTVLNLELATSPEIVGLAAGLRPHQATFVPERREEITTEGGLDLKAEIARPGEPLRRAMDRLRKAGIRISLFIDPDPEAIRLAATLGATAVELHTGDYAGATVDRRPQPLARLQRAAALGRQAGLAIHAGHGLTYRNVQPVAAIPEVEELNIGHSIISRSILTGIGPAVSEMRALIDAARAR
ncbi:MAG: pyridoxine 5'-phosphate synthase [Gemmatimonadetes bacterium]|nr:pyridoxine 5'-phosphate synthase [Gemmatimonadota bacterium]